MSIPELSCVLATRCHKNKVHEPALHVFFVSKFAHKIQKRQSTVLRVTRSKICLNRAIGAKISLYSFQR